MARFLALAFVAGIMSWGANEASAQSFYQFHGGGFRGQSSTIISVGLGNSGAFSYQHGIPWHGGFGHSGFGHGIPVYSGGIGYGVPVYGGFYSQPIYRPVYGGHSFYRGYYSGRNCGPGFYGW